MEYVQELGRIPGRSCQCGPASLNHKLPFQIFLERSRRIRWTVDDDIFFVRDFDSAARLLSRELLVTELFIRHLLDDSTDFEFGQVDLSKCYF